MTLDELERWLGLQIVGRYHAEIHSALLLPPRAAWDDAVAARAQPLRLPHDPERFLRDFLPFEQRSVRRDGLHLFGIRYWDDVLSPLAGRSSRRVRVRYDPRDLSCVFVEQAGELWPVRFAALDRPPITLGEHRLARAALRQRGIRSVDERLIFETIAEQRRLMESAVQQTRSMRRHTERRDRALASVSDIEAGQPELLEDNEICVDLVPLAVEEWS